MSFSFAPSQLSPLPKGGIIFIINLTFYFFCPLSLQILEGETQLMDIGQVCCFFDSHAVPLERLFNSVNPSLSGLSLALCLFCLTLAFESGCSGPILMTCLNLLICYFSRYCRPDSLPICCLSSSFLCLSLFVMFSAFLRHFISNIAILLSWSLPNAQVWQWQQSADIKTVLMNYLFVFLWVFGLK